MDRLENNENTQRHNATGPSFNPSLQNTFNSAEPPCTNSNEPYTSPPTTVNHYFRPSVLHSMQNVPQTSSSEQSIITVSPVRSNVQNEDLQTSPILFPNRFILNSSQNHIYTQPSSVIRFLAAPDHQTITNNRKRQTDHIHHRRISPYDPAPGTSFDTPMTSFPPNLFASQVNQSHLEHHDYVHQPNASISTVRHLEHHNYVNQRIDTEDNSNLPTQPVPVSPTLRGDHRIIDDEMQTDFAQQPSTAASNVNLSRFIVQPLSEDQLMRANVQQRQDLDMLVQQNDAAEEESNDAIRNVSNDQVMRDTENVIIVDNEDSNTESVASTICNKGNEEDEGDGQTCSICLDVWTSSGDHRLTSLKCGHLFGYTCINRWFKQMTKKDMCCPTCKSKACIKDMRFIYAKKIAMTDNSEVEELKTEIENLKTDKNRLEIELQQAKINQNMYFTKISALEREIGQLKKCSLEPAKSVTWKFALHANLEISKDSSCRILAYNSRSKDLYVSQLSTNALFPGYALRKINCGELRTGKLINLHPKLIRDASYLRENDLMVTVSMDKTVKLIQGFNDSVISTVNCDVPLWSCCWDKQNTNRFYVGCQGGVVLEYDVRQPKACITRLPASGDMSPVVSMTSVTKGFLACHLNSFRAHCREGSTFQSKQLPIEGSFLCCGHDEISNDVLISCRPSTNHSRNRHIVCRVDLENDFDFFVKSLIDGSNVQSLMSRSTIYSINDETFVAAHSEENKAVCVWTVAGGKKVQSLGASDNVVDILPISSEHGDLSQLVTLSPNRVRIYNVFACED